MMRLTDQSLGFFALYGQFNIIYCTGDGEKCFFVFLFFFLFLFGQKLFEIFFFCTDKYCVCVTVLFYLYFHFHLVSYFYKSFSIRTVICLCNSQLVNLLGFFSDGPILPT